MDRRIGQLEVKAIEQGKNLFIEGYASVFGVLDSYEDIVEKGAFTNTIQGKNFKRIAFCYQHEFSTVIGKIIELKEDEVGLWFKAKISNTNLGRDLVELISDGAISEISIGYRTKVSEINTETNVRMIKEVELYEISLVTRAANSEAFITQTEVKNEVVNDIPDEKPLSDLSNDELLSKRQDIELEISKRILKLV